MTKGSGTRSGLLWEVERLLNETEDLPQVLLMENVPQVHGSRNIDDFNLWIDFLKSKGYSNFWQDLNTMQGGNRQPMVVDEVVMNEREYKSDDDEQRTRYRIRKLTCREIWRLMGFSDEDFEKAQAVNSNSQLYKQAGNFIVKDVLMAIFRQMNIKGVEPWSK